MNEVDPWGYPQSLRLPFQACDFTGPNDLPCTSDANAHPGRHFTSDGRSWDMEPLIFDDEAFCRRCLAGVHSSEHAEKCYYPGLAEMGESA